MVQDGSETDQVNKTSYPTEIYFKNKQINNHTSPIWRKKYSLFQIQFCFQNNIKSNINLNNWLTQNSPQLFSAW